MNDLSAKQISLETPSPLWKDYEIIDSGGFEKLERFGQYVLRRPEPKALWDKSLSEVQWQRMTHTHFKPGAGFGKAGKEDSGTWDRLKKMDDQWTVRYRLGGNKACGSGGKGGETLTLRLGLTSFKHVGVFPEQAPNWDWIYKKVLSMREGWKPGSPASLSEGVPASTPKVLNLFAYTGAASLAARAAGADVTHLDSVRQVVTWARQNMELSSLDGIRWVVEDAMKFARRELKRGNRYNGIILDPPAYGHGPDGERWKLDECLFDMLRAVDGILAPENGFVVLNLYSNGYSAFLADTLVRQAFGNLKSVECGELALRDSFGKALPLSVVARITR